VLHPIDLIDAEDIERFGKETLDYVDGACEFLVDNKCSIHDTKPKICKEWYCVDHPIKIERYLRERDDWNKYN